MQDEDDTPFFCAPLGGKRQFLLPHRTGGMSPEQNQNSKKRKRTTLCVSTPWTHFRVLYKHCDAGIKPSRWLAMMFDKETLCGPWVGSVLGLSLSCEDANLGTMLCAMRCNEQVVVKEKWNLCSSCCTGWIGRKSELDKQVLCFFLILFNFFYFVRLSKTVVSMSDAPVEGF